jgi:membrane protease YdiL (CAAX protease family)
MPRHVTLLGGSALLAASLRVLLQSGDRITQLDELQDWPSKLDADIDTVVVDLPTDARLAAVEKIRVSYRGRLIVLVDPADDHAERLAERDCLVLNRPLDIGELSTLVTTDPPDLINPTNQSAPEAFPRDLEATRPRLIRNPSGPSGGRRAPATASIAAAVTASTGRLVRAASSDVAAGTASAASRPVALAGTSLLVAYLGVVAVIELAWRPLGVSVLASAACHGLFALLLCLPLWATADPRTATLLPPLIAVSVVRLIAFAALPAAVHPLLHLLVVGAPALVAIAMSARLRPPEWRLLRPHTWGWHGQALVALLGIPFAVLVWLLAPPTVQVTMGTPTVVAATILVVFAALPDELLFRGLLTPACVGVAGGWGLPLSSAVYALSYLPGGSGRTILLAFLLGMALGWCRQRTGSIVGVAAAHGLLNVLVFMALPVPGS